MSTPRTITLGELIKRFRTIRGLTQDELAERARLSVRAISDLERGVRRAPHKDTLALLAGALGLGEAERTLLMEAARGARGAAASAAPPPTGTSVSASAIPSALTALIGREREEAAVGHLLCRADVRLLTLTGPAGIGKTSLAQQVATDVSAHFPAGVVVVSLATVVDPGLVLATIAQALNLQEQEAQPADEQLRDYLANRELLLVLDNFEQVTRAGPDVARLLAACPRVKALVTSRAALRVRGEQEFAVPPLDIPDLARLPPLGDLAQYAAVALFVHRAQAVKPTFELTPAMAPTIAAICVRLDGLPLAIELAAAHIKVLSPQALLARLAPCLPLLTHGSSDLPARQQTMRGAIAWSYDLLDASEQRLFRRLAVFAGGCTLEAAEAVCAERDERSADILQKLTALVDKSLVLPEEDAEGAPRFRLLELLREYGLERLVAHDEERTLRQRHADYYLALALRAEPELRGEHQVRWLARLTGENANLRAALGWAEANGAVELGLQLAGAIWWFWQVRGHVREGRAWLARFLSLQQTTECAADKTLRADALKGAGNLAWCQGDYEPAAELLKESLDLYRALGNVRGIAHVLNTLGLIADARGDYGRAVDLFEQSLALFRELDDTTKIGALLNNLAIVAHRRGRYAEAIALYEESLALHRKVDDQWSIALTLNNLGETMRVHGDLDRATTFMESSLTLYKELGDKEGIALALGNLGDIARERGNLERAAQLQRDSLVYASDVGAKALIAGRLDCAAEVALAQGRAEQATRLFALATALRERNHMRRSADNVSRCESKIAALRTTLGDEMFEAEWAIGRALTLDQARALLDKH